MPGVLHDVCSAVHPFARRLAVPVHPAAGRARPRLALARRSTSRTRSTTAAPACCCGRSTTPRRAWASTGRVARPSARWSTSSTRCADDLMRPDPHVPRHPLRLARFGLRRPAARDACWPAVRHATRPGRSSPGAPPTSSSRSTGRPRSVGLMLDRRRPPRGWPVAEGGSRAITDALASLLRSLGGTIETGVAGHGRWPTLPRPGALFDIGPRRARASSATRCRARVRRAYARYRHGPGAFKVDLAVEGGVPWTSEPARRAGTVHVGGTFEEVAAAEARRRTGGACPSARSCWSAQQYLADPSRSVGDVHPIWAYAHVPHGYAGDATEAILAPARAVRARRPRAHRRHPRHRPGRARGVQRQLRRRRHRHRGDDRGRWSSGRAWPSTPTPRGSPACSSARRRRRPAPASTACAATTPRCGRSGLVGHHRL